jgi:hypothetical protein
MDGLVAVTVTPGSTAALVSVTRPVIVPVELAPPPWAKAEGAASRTLQATSVQREHRFMTNLLEKPNINRMSAEADGDD